MSPWSKPMNQLTEDILLEILDENVSEEAWYSILESMLTNSYLRDVKKIFFEAICVGHLPLIRIFSERGVDAFTIAEDDKTDERKAPIFGLCYLKNKKVTPHEILETIFSGKRTYYMSKLANSKKGDFNTFFSQNKDETKVQPKTLLEEAICIDNKEVTDYLIEYSKPKRVYGANGLTPLHWAVLKDDKPLIKKLLQKGLCPFNEAIFYPARWEKASMLWKYFNGDTTACNNALKASDSFDLARLRKPSNADFLNAEYDKLKHYLEYDSEDEQEDTFEEKEEDTEQEEEEEDLNNKSKKRVHFDEPITEEEKSIKDYLNKLVDTDEEDNIETKNEDITE